MTRKNTTTTAALEALNNPTPVKAGVIEFEARIAQLEAQLAAEQAKNAPKKREVYLKVSEKGGASLYGIRRFPITFYVEEWNSILDMEPLIRAFLDAHKDELRTKN